MLRAKLYRWAHLQVHLHLLTMTILDKGSFQLRGNWETGATALQHQHHGVATATGGHT